MYALKRSPMARAGGRGAGAVRRRARTGVCSGRTGRPPFALQAAVAQGVAVAQGPDTTAITSQIVEKEAELAALFEPGRPMPRAAVVASLRQEISNMKEQLASLMGMAPSGGFVSQEDSEDWDAKAREAFLEVERIVDERSGRSWHDDSAAVAQLEAENERLRTEATALLHHQQKLEDVLGKLQSEQRERMHKGAFNSSMATEAAAEMVAAEMVEHVTQAARMGDGVGLGTGTRNR